jgi:hypothetical protein
MKTCTQYKTEKPLTEYSKKRGAKNGHRNICRECSKIKSETFRQKQLSDPSIMIVCTDCGDEKSIVEFFTTKLCKKCYYKFTKKKNIENRTPDVVIEKECCGCHEILPAKNFSKNISHKDGLSANCKKCASEYLKLYRQEHGEEIKQQKKDSYYANPNRLEDGLKYREENRERIRAFDRASSKKNRAKKTARDRICRIKRRNSDPTFRAYNNLKRNVLHYLDKYALLGKVNKSKEFIDTNIFGILGPRPGKSFHLDHIIPIRAYENGPCCK